MLSDEWKMSIGNECEISVCWLGIALPKVSEQESVKKRKKVRMNKKVTMQKNNQTLNT